MGIDSYFFEKSKRGSFVSKSPRGYSTNCIIFLIVEYHPVNERPHLLPSCGDSRSLIPFIPPGWVYINILPFLLKPSCGAAWDERVGETWGPRAHPVLSHLGTPGRALGTPGRALGDRFAFVCPFESTSLASLPSEGRKGRRSRPIPFLLPFRPLNPSHSFDDSKNTTYIKWKFGVSAKSECSNHSVEIMVKLLLTWEGALRGFVNAPVIVSIEAFIFMHLVVFCFFFFFPWEQKKSQKRFCYLHGEIRTLISL